MEIELTKYLDAVDVVNDIIAELTSRGFTTESAEGAWGLYEAIINCILKEKSEKLPGDIPKEKSEMVFDNFFKPGPQNELKALYDEYFWHKGKNICEKIYLDFP